jgi:hypothetical protein
MKRSLERPNLALTVIIRLSARCSTILMEPDQESQFFNLQLTVQKLEEELLLYRNGTTTQELMEFIS